MYSMTGFAQGQAQSQTYLLDLEIRAYNNRYAEIALHLPPSLCTQEQWSRDQLAQTISRGKISFSCKISFNTQNLAPVNLEKAHAFHLLVNTLHAQGLKPYYGFAELRHYGVFEEQTDTTLPTVYQQAFTTILQEFQNARASEGLKLKEDILSQLSEIQKILQKIESLAPQVETEYTKKIQDQFFHITQNQASESRILEEIAAYLIKINVHEEIARLKIHVQAMLDTCTHGFNCGRKLDFLSQEIQREITTLSNKTPLIDLQLLAVDLKSSLEKIREQARNVE
ncbi:MAG: YicC/YloC family endoribonuclease [Spirochaetia bacterium]